MKCKKNCFHRFAGKFPLKLKYPLTVFGLICIFLLALCDLGIIKNRHPRPIVYVYWIVCIIAEVVIQHSKKKRTENNSAPPA